MGVFLAILMMMTTASVAIFVVARFRRDGSSSNDRSRFVAFLMLASAALIFCDLLFGGESIEFRLPFDMTISLLPMLVIASSLFEPPSAARAGKILMAPLFLLQIFYILQGAGAIPAIRVSVFIVMAALTAMLACATYIIALSLRMRSVSMVMSSGNAWSYASISVEIIYLLFMVIDIFCLISSLCVSMTCVRIVSAIVSCLLAFQLAALGMRVGVDSLFVIWQRQERRIVESMKMSQTDVSKTSSKTNELYGDIYARIVALFEIEKPYLNSELTINDVVKKIFTNKLYISRAISQFTGRNFCQFVNYYRVAYSIKIFRANPDLKVVELANQSGFNSSVSFSMAFRLFMSECPSDWCRKERSKIARGKK